MVRKGVVSGGAPSRWMGESVAGTSPSFWQQRARRRWRSRITVVGGGDRDPRWASTKSGVSKPRWVLWAQKTLPQRSKFKKLSGAQRRVVSQCVPNPDAIKAEAVAEVQRLQKALDALGGLGGPEVDAIKRVLKKAQEVARERPVAELVKECKEFIERSTERITKLKTELETETAVLEDSRARLTRLAAQAAPVGDRVVAQGARVLATKVNQRDPFPRSCGGVVHPRQGHGVGTGHQMSVPFNPCQITIRGSRSG